MVNSLSKVVGGSLLVAGTAAIWLWPEAKAPQAAPEPLRPVRSEIVKDATKMPDLKFSGTVKAGADRTMMFKRPGRIARIPVKKGQLVRKGEKLAWLMQDDFQNALAQDEAAVQRDKLTYARVTKAAQKNAVSREEVSKAEANLKQSEARYALAKRALEETVLYAPFDSMVADIPATELNMVGTADPIVVLLDLSTIKIDAAVPEAVVIKQHQFRCREDGTDLLVTFDSAQAESYPVTFVEYKATADELNQTFTATYSLPAPEGLVLLPGMSATIHVPGDSYAPANAVETSVEVPASAIGVDSDGSYFAWVLTPEAPAAQAPASPNAVFAARKRKLGACKHVAGIVRVASGLKAGERIATAGVTVLTEGRRVTLMKGVGQ